MPSRDFTSEDLFSSRMISMHSSTHSSQMYTVGPAMSLRTSCWLLPQNEQWRGSFESLLAPFLIIRPTQSVRRRRSPKTCPSQPRPQREVRAIAALNHGDLERSCDP